MKAETKQKIIEYIKWDYGIDLSKTDKYIENFLKKKAVKNITRFFTALGVFLAAGFTGGVLSLLFFAHPDLIAILILLDTWGVILAYYYYNDKLDDKIEFIREKINAKKKD